MGVKIARKKPKNLLLSVLYRLNSIVPLSNKAKIKLFLNLEWIFDRLVHETSFKLYNEEDHPMRYSSKEFILNKIEANHTVLDLGSNQGFISNFIAEKAKKVVGVDYNQEAIHLAEKRFPKANLTFVCGEAFEYLESNTTKFDALILSHILEHLDHPNELLDKLKSHFSLIYIEVPDFDKGYLNQYRNDFGVDLIYTDDDHVHEFDREEMKALILSSGLSIAEEEYKNGVQRIWCKTNSNS
ncbi:MAG: hypothetical protein CL840_22125 [Crocinitomicaceae bacterium]|nr:hypothetical protein [Crocinitomicaceae bacterium]|tara:strand:- start:1682 stop:2404 length:723 start_codon:yes stop_codon:yes gene_type:complete